MFELLQYVCYYVVLGSVRAESLYYDLLDEPCCFILHSYVILIGPYGNERSQLESTFASIRSNIKFFTNS